MGLLTRERSISIAGANEAINNSSSSVGVAREIVSSTKAVGLILDSPRRQKYLNIRNNSAGRDRQAVNNKSSDAREAVNSRNGRGRGNREAVNNRGGSAECAWDVGDKRRNSASWFNTELVRVLVKNRNCSAAAARDAVNRAEVVILAVKNKSDMA